MKAMVTDENLPKETRPRKVSPVTVTALGGVHFIIYLCL